MNKKKLLCSMIKVNLFIMVMLTADTVVMFGVMNVSNIVSFAISMNYPQLGSAEIGLAAKWMLISVLFMLVMVFWYGFKMVNEIGGWFEKRLGVDVIEKTDLHKVQE